MQQEIEVCGKNNKFNISEKSNNHLRDKSSFISPAMKSEFDVATISSYSLFNKTVIITNDGLTLAIGDNTKSQISGSLPKRVLEKFTKIELRDMKNHICQATSALCGNDYTLYLIQPSDEDSPKQLAYAHTNLNTEHPVILNIGNIEPVALFGGYYDCAVITSTGTIAYINGALFDMPGTKINESFLPDNDRAINVCCCYSFIIALSIKGKVYESKRDSVLVFNEVPELKGKKITSISGIFQHCIAVGEDGKAYIRGEDSINSGFLCLGKGTSSPKEFKEITALQKYQIVEAYAGTDHSLFKTSDGVVLGCGDNKFGELCSSSGPSRDKIFKPVETTIPDPTFCIAGDYATVIFKNCQPPMCPNRPIKK